jgi:hypothetical protein
MTARFDPGGVVTISRGLSPAFADDTPGTVKIQIHFDSGGVAAPLRVAIASIETNHRASRTAMHSPPRTLLSPLPG